MPDTMGTPIVYGMPSRTRAELAASSSATSMSPSASSVVSTLVPVLLLAIVYMILFLIFRPHFKRFYQPRTFVTSLRSEARSPAVPQGLANWFKDFWALPDTYVLNHSSLDGYLLLRLLKISVVICLVGCVITFPILFPVNATGGGSASQLDIITMANISNPWRYWAHAVCAILFFGFVIFMITRESIFYINLRQAYLLSPLYASRMSSRTVLFCSVPDEYMEEGKLRWMLGHGVRRVWPVADVDDLDEKVNDRDSAALKLEGAETKLIKTANGKRVKEEKKAAKKGGRSESEEGAVEHGQGSVAERYLTQKDRPTHRLKFLIGKKVDTIDWCRAELKRLIPEVDTLQAEHQAHKSKMLNSVFVEFDTVTDAQTAFQSLTHHHALHMSPKFAGVYPGEVIWSNLGIKWWERVIRKFATLSLVIALIIFWALPVAAIGAISHINSLEQTSGFTWLQFLNKLPNVILGVVTGLLPVVLLAVLMALLPIILRWMAKLGGAPTRSAVELTVQNTYFAFQVIQVFLVTTIGSSASVVGGRIAKNPSLAPQLLAQNIPKASTFFLCYFILQGLAVVSSILLSLSGLVIFMLLGKLLDSTPRKMYNRWIKLSGLGWGTVFPIYTNLLVIGICYAIIAPLVLIFAAIGLSLFYLAYRYNLLFVSQTDIDTKGRVYPRALQQIFVGLYIAEVCLIGLFAVAIPGGVGAVGPLILMILMLIFTALYQVSLNAALDPMINYLPKTLEAEERALQAAETGGEHGEKNNGVSKEARAFENGRVDADSSGAPHKRPNFFTKWLRPDLYCDYASMRRLVPKDIAIQYTEEDEFNAYFHPSISQEVPLLWIPRDPMGISRKEIADTKPIIPITDEGAYLDEKNKIVWDAPDGRPPIYTPTPYY